MKINMTIQDKSNRNEFRVMNKNVRVVLSDYRDVIYFISCNFYRYPGQSGYRVQKRMEKYED